MTNDLLVEAIRSIKSTDGNQWQANAVEATNGPDAVARFQAAMAPDAVGEVSKVAPVPFADEVSAVWQNAQVNHQELLHRISALSELAQRGTTPVAMLELQYEVMNLSFQQEIVSKVADKTSSAVQTLVKNQ